MKYFVKYCNSSKLNSFKPCIFEFTVFISVRIDNLNELSTFIPEMVSNEDKMNNDSININTEIKYLFISLVSIIVSENSSLLIKTLIGFAWETNSLIENLKREYSLTRRIPELVEKKEPPIIVIIKNKKDILVYDPFKDNPMLEILLVSGKKISLNV